MTIVPSIRANFIRSAVFALSFISSIPWTNAAESLSWNGWTLVYEVSGNYDGLSLVNVMYQNLLIIRKISLPAVRVFYDNNACGPFVDRLGGTLSPIPWANNATIARREFMLSGRLWYELGIRDKIGNYDLYQVYYLSEDGILDAHIFSKGLQCVVNHIHYPIWRIDFDIRGSHNDQIQFDPGTGYQTSNIEFNANATSAINHSWQVRDSATGLNVYILPGFTDFTIPAANNLAVTDYSNHTVFGRLYKTAEDIPWTYGPNTQVPFGNGEPIDNQNIVYWYEAYLDHSAVEGSNLWHSTGVRLAVNASSLPPQPQPQPSNTQSFTNNASIAIGDNRPASPYPSTINVSGMTGTITDVKVTLNGVRHTYPDDLDLLLVRPNGQKLVLMSDTGGSTDLQGSTLTFRSSASNSLPNSTPIFTGTYLPTNVGTGDTFSAPAPPSPYSGSLTVFNQTSPNGSWQLFVIDDAANDSGTIDNGWTIDITTN